MAKGSTSDAATEAGSAAAGAVDKWVAGLYDGNVDVPDWLEDTVVRIVRTANELLPGQGRGQARKRWANGALREYLRSHDIEGLPNWIETPAESVLCAFVIEFAFKQLWRAGQLG